MKDLLKTYQPRGNYSNNIISSIRMNSAKNPGMKAVIGEDRLLTWSQAWDRAKRLGNGLVDLGIQKGERLGNTAIQVS